MNDDNIRHGGSVGAFIAFIVTAIAVPLFVMGSTRGPRDPLIEPRLFEAAVGSTFCLSLIFAALGYIAGREGARTKSTVLASIKGGVLFTCAIAAFVMSNLPPTAPSHAIVVTLIFSCSIIAAGMLASGMAAIAVRDYSHFGWMRLFPHFTRPEILIVLAIVGVIISAMTTIAVLRP
jgi:hypothetical protein